MKLPPHRFQSFPTARLTPQNRPTQPHRAYNRGSPMRVEVVLTETDIAQEFAEAMEARDLPEKFFYWFPRSVAEWEVLAANPELYGGLAATWGRMTGYIQSLTQHITGQIPVISFGAGDG